MNANELERIEVGMEIYYYDSKEVVTSVSDDKYYYDFYEDGYFRGSDSHSNNPSEWTDEYEIIFNKSRNFETLYNKLNGSN